jgi:hypothetical protein
MSERSTLFRRLMLLDGAPFQLVLVLAVLREQG